MTDDTFDRSVDFNTTEGLLYRALCVLIDRNHGHLTIPMDELESVSGQFVMGADEDGLILTTLRGEGDVEH